jgi:hypothetical protein
MQANKPASDARCAISDKGRYHSLTGGREQEDDTGCIKSRFRPRGASRVVRSPIRTPQNALSSSSPPISAIMLFAGTHEPEQISTRQALELKQWRYRFHAGQALPGISEEEAADIVHSELGWGCRSGKSKS